MGSKQQESSLCAAPFFFFPARPPPSQPGVLTKHGVCVCKEAGGEVLLIGVVGDGGVRDQLNGGKDGGWSRVQWLEVRWTSSVV